MSTLRSAVQVISDAISELNSRQNSINSLTSQVNNLTSQVNTLTGQVNSLTGDLDNVYNVIVDNTVGVVVVKENIDQYGVYCQSIINAYNTIVADKDTTISARNTTISTYEGYFSDICNNISVMGGTVADPVVYANVADYVLTIPQSSSPTVYIGYLNDIYTVISANNQGITVTSGDYQNFDDNISAIINALKSQISTLQNQLSTANQTITTYQGYFADIAAAITSKGGTVTDSTDYSSYDDYVSGIPSGGQTVDQGIIAFGNLKTQIYEIDAMGTNSDHDNYEINILGDCTNMFRYMGYSNKNALPFGNNEKLNLSGLTNATDMFGHVTDDGQGNLSIDTYLGGLPNLTGGIGTSYQGDLSIDLRCFESVDFDGWKSSFPRNNTGYVRELILRSYNYEQNVNWGGVRTLTSKGYTIRDGGETRP